MKILLVVLITLFATGANAGPIGEAGSTVDAHARDATQASAHDTVPVDTLTGQVGSIGEEYGNIETTIEQNHLDALGISTGDLFIVTHGDQSVTVLLGKTYEDVERGEWISFLNWEGKLRLARSFANAADTLGAMPGDEIILSRAPVPVESMPD